MPSLRALTLVFLLAAALPAASVAAQCGNTSTGLVPLTQLIGGTYQGQPGGLYPGQTNVAPADHRAAGLLLAQSIEPLDTLGAPSPSGRIVLLSIGMSNTAQEFSAFVPVANAYAGKNPHVAVINGAQGGQTAHVFADPFAEAWDVADARLRQAGLSPLQVQAVWIKEANARPTEPFPQHAELLRDDLRAVVRNLHDRYPNARLCYLSSRTYGGYASTDLNPEPYAYESAFAVRWLIEEQLSGDLDLNFDAERGAIVAPWLAWGPYLWADGTTPRTDGLTWVCSDFGDDGTHPSTAGRDKVAQLLLDFLASEETATPWFLRSMTSVAGASPAERSWAIERAWPVPSTDRVSLSLRVASPRWLRVDVVTLTGRLVRRLAARTFAAGSSLLVWDGHDDSGSRASTGLYFVRVSARTGPATQDRIILIR